MVAKKVVGAVVDAAGLGEKGPGGYKRGGESARSSAAVGPTALSDFISSLPFAVRLSPPPRRSPI